MSLCALFIYDLKLMINDFNYDCSTTKNINGYISLIIRISSIAKIEQLGRRIHK